MSAPIRQYAYLESFACLGASCPDTCCIGWSLPADAPQKQLYQTKAPELLSAIDEENTMRRDASGACRQLQGGMCGIHAKYGSDYLSDSCHFYPRLLRRIGDMPVMSANLSCPEITRLVLEMDAPFVLKNAMLDRMPHQMASVAAQADHAQALMEACMAYALDPLRTPQQSLSQLLALAQKLQAAPKEEWLGVFERHRHDEQPIVAEAHPTDLHRIYYGLALLIAFGQPNDRIRLEPILERMEQGLHCRMNWNSREIAFDPDAADAAVALHSRWQSHEAHYADILRRWLGAQLAIRHFPYGGFPQLTLPERMLILSARFATLKLALMCYRDEQGPPDHATCIELIQRLSRFMDHIADPSLSLSIYRDAGWTSDERIHGLIQG